ncbi:MAG: ATP-binding protein [Holdemanella sp.]|nr:ATP-binding protein [Holdemanella sp.]
MIKRSIADKIRKSMLQVPVVTILGPRQAGKTTLVKELYPEYTYVNLEDRTTRELAENDYIGFFKKYSEPMIIDEVQRVPELLSAIQVKVDEDRRKNGRFILTGSHQPRLREAVAQSLAGRTTIHTLYPLSLEEIKGSGKLEEIDDNIVRGFMPELYLDNARDPDVYYRDYLDTYIEKDLRQMVAVKDLNAFLRFLTLLAGRVGQIVNLSGMSGEVGVSSTTLSEWLSVLEDSFVVFRLQPYFSNISKRIVKSPKVYFVEPGLAAYLLGIESARQASRDPLRGNLFENIVVLEAVKTRLNDNKEPNLFYMRTEKGVEVDMILKKEGILYPFEIKSAMTPNSNFSKNMKLFCGSEPTAGKMTVIYCGDDYESFQGCRYIHYTEIADIIRE